MGRNQRRLTYAYDSGAGTIEETETWNAIGGAPRRDAVVPIVYRRNGDRYESRIADNFIFRDPPTTFG